MKRLLYWLISTIIIITYVWLVYYVEQQSIPATIAILIGYVLGNVHRIIDAIYIIS